MAEETKGTTTTAENTEKEGTKLDFSDTAKIYEMLGKIEKHVSDNKLKSALKDNGATDEEISDIISGYRASKKTKADEYKNEFAKISKENETLKAQIFNADFNKTAAEVAKEVGIKSDKLNFALKVADLTKAKADGKINKEELKTALEQVLTDIPEFKETKDESYTEGGIRKLGIQQTDNEKEKSQINKMREIMGLNKID